jgi:hypothetical protein
MRSTITYRRPAPVNKHNWDGGKVGNAFGPVRKGPQPELPKTLPTSLHQLELALGKKPS